MRTDWTSPIQFWLLPDWQLSMPPATAWGKKRTSICTRSESIKVERSWEAWEKTLISRKMLFKYLIMAYPFSFLPLLSLWPFIFSEYQNIRTTQSIKSWLLLFLKACQLFKNIQAHKIALQSEQWRSNLISKEWRLFLLNYHLPKSKQYICWCLAKTRETKLPNSLLNW